MQLDKEAILNESKVLFKLFNEGKLTAHQVEKNENFEEFLIIPSGSSKKFLDFKTYQNLLLEYKLLRWKGLNEDRNGKKHGLRKTFYRGLFSMSAEAKLYDKAPFSAFIKNTDVDNIAKMFKEDFIIFIDLELTRFAGTLYDDIELNKIDFEVVRKGCPTQNISNITKYKNCTGLNNVYIRGKIN